MTPEGASLAEYAAGASAALFALVVGLQKVLKGWRETNAESSVISLMRTELERMSAHNRVLSTELASLQVEIISLNKELRKLTSENQKLHQEVVSLTEEVNRLQILLQSRPGAERSAATDD